MYMLPYYWPILKTRTLNKAKNHPPPPPPSPYHHHDHHHDNHYDHHDPQHDPPPHHHVCFTHFHKTSSFFMPQHGAP